MSRIIASLYCSSALCVLISFHPAYAQQGDQPASASGNPGQLEEIVVTARKTEEKLQVTPVSVTAISEAKLEQLNVDTIQGLNGLAPNLTVTAGVGHTGSVVATIRGLQNSDPLLTQDSPVALYVDGVYVARQVGGLFDLVDLERVEVLRGPQGTLFGRNTTAGAINFITKAPTDDFWIEEKAGYGSFNDFKTRTVVNTGLIGDTGLKALISYSHHQDDGYVRNTLTSSDNGWGSIASDAFFLNLTGDLSDALSFSYKADYFVSDGQSPPLFLTEGSPVFTSYFGASPKFGGAPLVISPNGSGTNSVFQADPPDHTSVLGHSLTVDYDVSDFLRLKSITAYRSLGDEAHSDQVGQGLLEGPVFNNDGTVTVQRIAPYTAGLCPGNVPNFPSNGCDNNHQYQISEEFQANGTVGEFKYVGGLFFFDEHIAETNPDFLTVALPIQAVVAGFPAAVQPAALAYYSSLPSIKATNGTVGVQSYPVGHYYGESKSFAAYGQTSYRPDFLDDKFEFTFGLRYTYDQKTIHIRNYNANTPPPDFDLPAGYTSYANEANNFHNLSYLLSGNYQFTDDLMGYVRISSGYKAGGQNGRIAGNIYQPETATSFEGGFKSEFFDHRLRINADVFYTQYDNQQEEIVIVDPATNQATGETLNAASVDYLGGELEFSFIPAEHWLVDGSFGYTDPQFNTFLTNLPGSTQLVNLANSADLPFASKETYAIGVQYDFEPFTFGDLSVRMDYNYASPRNFVALSEIDPLKETIKSGSFHNLGAVVMLKNIETDYGSWQAKFYATNLLDEQQRINGTDFEIVTGVSNFASSTYGPPRAFGFDVTYKFAPTAHEAATPTAFVPPPVQAVAPAPKSYLVFFDFNKSDLTPQAVTIVDQAAHNSGPAKVTQLTVTGHTDTVGSDAYNMRLSRRRAESVASQLEKDGIPSSEISIVAKGKRDLLVPTADGVKEPQNRRVQIVYDGGADS